MAAVLDALAPFVKKLVKDMAEEEVSKLLGVSGEITKLDGTVESLRAFVSDAENRRITDDSVQKWVNKLKDAMYDATDIMELCQLEADERRELEKLGEGGNREQNLLACFQPLLVWLQNPVVTLITCGGVEKMQGFFQRFLFCLRNPVFADEIGTRIKELNQRLEGIYKEADQQFKFHRNLGSSNPEPRKLTAVELSSYKTISRVDESAIVGEQIERDTKQLVQVLITDDNKNHNIKVVSIIGTGGMGKTTLAQKIFNDATIQENFETKIWLSITKQFDEAELLRTAIKHAGGDHGGENEKSTLTDTLIKTLSTKRRFLLVMDDLWSLEAWKDVLQAPVRIASNEQPGSRVLVTTRSADLAQQMQAILHQHRVRPLDNEDAWSLLKRQLQPDQVDGIDDQLKTIGMEILEKCEGLPLAIKVIGGLLSTRYPSEDQWRAVLNKPSWSLNGLPPELDNRLYLSYQDMSPQLKQCFLYCSLIPKGDRIVHLAITGMWISEGFIQPQDDTISISHEYGLEEMAIENYQELIKRNLIEPLEGYELTGYVCRMHDVVHSFAEYMAREESLVVVGREKQAPNHGIGNAMHIRRLSVKQTEEQKILQRQDSIRTLIIIDSSINFLPPGESLASFSSLRVLLICSVDFGTLATSLSKLKHLRYLHLEGSDISRLPDDIHMLKFLWYITLIGCVKLCYLPSSIIKLKHLRSLRMEESNVTAVPKGFGGLTNLVTLIGFPVHVDSSWCSLQELTPLSQLRVLSICGLEKLNDSQMVEKAMLSRMCHLNYLELRYGASGHMMLQSDIEEVLEKLCPPTCIENLRLVSGYVGRQLPNWMHAPASKGFKSLRYLELANLPCCTQLPDGLCCLPSLETLNIKDVPAIKCVGPEFQASSPLAAPTSAPFPKLVLLEMSGLCAWEEWEWNNHGEEFANATIAMPRLESLRIMKCKLSCLPPGLASSKRDALRELTLEEVTKLTDVENFPSVVKLYVNYCPELKRISGLPMLQHIEIFGCPKVEVLEGVTALDSLVLADPAMVMDTLPDFLQTVRPRHLTVCSNLQRLRDDLVNGGSEYDKLTHIEHIELCYVQN